MFKITNMNENRDWLTQLREKNKNMPVKDISKDYQVVITDFYQISKPGSKEVEWVCRRRK